MPLRGHNSSTGRSYVIFGVNGIGSDGILPLSSLNGVNGFKIDGEMAGDGSGFITNLAGILMVMAILHWSLAYTVMII